tara:strand:+ start:753 stop:1910 length:1158 start_codon:yes stop_codon:yes gene_type:complete
MSKSSREGLFGITLTELVIILFFIMLLLAIFNIEQVNEELEEAQNLIPESSEDVISQSAVITWLFPDGEIESDLLPAKVIEDKIRELQKAKEEFQKLTEETSEGDGDCREDGFWITSKCADHCWEIDSSEVTRQYDYLVDIGVCKSSVVVQRSQWVQKSESDFMVVDGALEMTNKNVMKASELYEFLDIIKQPGYTRQPKQCFHYVRLVDLGAGSIPRWETIDKEVANRVGRLPLTSADRGYQNIRDRFPNDICSLYDSNTSTENRNISYGNDLIKNQQPIEIIKAELNLPSFQNSAERECRRSSTFRNNEITLEFLIEVDSFGNAQSVILSSNNPSLNNQNSRLSRVAINALKKSSYSPEMVGGVAKESQKIKKLKFPENFCGF